MSNKLKPQQTSVPSSTIKSPLRLFISYAHADGAVLASRLADDLHASGFTTWWDQQRLTPGAHWTTDIEVAIDQADVIVALLSEGSYHSDICRAEQLRALRKGKRVIPVMLQKDAELPIHLETEQYLPFYGDYGAGLKQLIAAIGNDQVTASLLAKYKKRYLTFPPLPLHFVPRRHLLESLRRAIIQEKDQRTTPITAIRGMGGIGKTVLAQAICHDEAVQDAFPDGVMWVTIGKNPSNCHLLEQIRELAKALGDSLEGYDTLYGSENQLRMTLKDKSVLIVLDDVWDPRHVKHFLGDAPRCRILLTTRSQEVIHGTDAEEFVAQAMDEEESMTLLARKSGLAVNELPREAAEIIARCGSLPLGLAMLGARARKGKNEWARIVRALKEGQMQKLGLQLSDYLYSDLFEATQVSVESLKPLQKARYQDLAVFPPDVVIPMSVLQIFWDTEADDVDDTVEGWEEASLATRDETGITLHDLQLDYLHSRTPDLKRLHRKLISAYKCTLHGGWASGPDDGYYFAWLPYHLREAGEMEELHSLLLCPEWMRVKLRTGGVSSLVADYEFAGEDADLRLIQQTLQLSAHVLAKDQIQLAGQLFGRLKASASPSIQNLLSTIRSSQAAPWLEPVCSTLWVPGTLMLFTLAGHSLRVNAVVVSADGKLAVSASVDGTLKVWDLETGRLKRTLAGHAGSVDSVAITPDGRRTVSASDDTNLKVWDLETGSTVHTLSGHKNVVSAVSIFKDGQQEISASDDRTVKVWDLQAGTDIRTLAGHGGRISALAVSPDGKLAISASSDHSLKVWDLESGTQRFDLTGHADTITALAIKSNGRRAVSASNDKTLRVWDLAQGKELHVLVGHTGRVTAVALTPDETKALSAAHDRTLRLWDLQSGTELQIFCGHLQAITALAVSNNGKQAASASTDQTVKVWELNNGAELRTFTAHSGGVTAVAITPDGTRAISASDDTTLKVWRMETKLEQSAEHLNFISCVTITEDGQLAISGSYDKTLKVWSCKDRTLLHTLAGHSGPVSAVAASLDGRWVLSGSHDGTLKVWDIQTGSELRTLRGHSGAISQVIIMPDGRRALSASYDKTLRIWDMQAGTELHTLEGNSTKMAFTTTPAGLTMRDLTDQNLEHVVVSHAQPLIAVAVTPDGRHAVSACFDKTVKIWDVGTGKIVRTLSGHSAWVSSITIAKNGSQALSSSYDKTLKLWDLQLDKELLTLAGHSGSVTRAVFSSDGTEAISASTDRTIKLWDLKTGTLLRSFTAPSSPVTGLVITSSGKYLIAAFENNTLKVWSHDGGDIAAFSSDGSLLCLAASRNAETVIVGDYLGRMHLLHLHDTA